MEKAGVKCSNDRIRRLMKGMHLVLVQTSKFKATTNSNNSLPVAQNLLKQDFNADEPCQKWVGDISYIATEEGWLYLAAIIDLFSRKMVGGWALVARMTKQLVIDAMSQALHIEKPPEGLIFHSDRGSQYISYDYQDLLREHGIRQSMSAKGDCYDNACAESFFATLKKELVHRRRFKTRSWAKLEIIDHILWCNSERIYCFRTGDIVYIDEEGWLNFIDRKVDLIKHKGYRISASRLEKVLQAHYAVVACCVVGVPDEKVGETVKAYVTTRSDINGVSGGELIQWCRMNLTAYEIPHYIEFRDVLPKSKVGKLLKRELRDDERRRMEP